MKENASPSPKEIKDLWRRFNTDKSIRQNIEREIPDIAAFLKSCRSELDIEMALMPPGIATLQEKLILAENKNDREACSRITRALLKELDKAEFPILVGMTYLKLGTTLIMLSPKDVNLLKESITSLTLAIEYLPSSEPDMLSMAYYNLALAYADERLFEWDNADDNWQKCIFYGEKLLGLLPNRSIEKQFNIKTILLNLGNAYRNISSGEREDNLDKSIQYFKQLLIYLEDEKDKESLGRKLYVMEALSKIYLTRKRGNEAENKATSMDYVNKAMKYVR